MISQQLPVMLPARCDNMSLRQAQAEVHLLPNCRRATALQDPYRLQEEWQALDMNAARKQIRRKGTGYRAVPAGRMCA